MSSDLQVALVSSAIGLIGVFAGGAISWLTSKTLAASQAKRDQLKSLLDRRLSAYADFLAEFTRLQLQGPKDLRWIGDDDVNLTTRLLVIELIGSADAHHEARELFHAYSDRRKETPENQSPGLAGRLVLHREELIRVIKNELQRELLRDVP